METTVSGLGFRVSQNVDPILVPLGIKCRTRICGQKGPIILRTTQMVKSGFQVHLDATSSHP